MSEKCPNCGSTYTHIVSSKQNHTSVDRGVAWGVVLLPVVGALIGGPIGGAIGAALGTGAGRTISTAAGCVKDDYSKTTYYKCDKCQHTWSK